MNAIHPDWIASKTVNIIVQFGLDRDPALPDVRLLSSATNAEETAILKAVMNSTALGLSLFTAPGVPADRLTALRRAFDATMADADFLSEVENRGRLCTSPLPGERLQALVSEVSDLSPELTVKAKAAYLDVK